MPKDKQDCKHGIGHEGVHSCDGCCGIETLQESKTIMPKTDKTATRNISSYLEAWDKYFQENGYLAGEQTKPDMIGSDEVKDFLKKALEEVVESVPDKPIPNRFPEDREFIAIDYLTQWKKDKLKE